MKPGRRHRADAAAGQSALLGPQVRRGGAYSSGPGFVTTYTRFSESEGNTVYLGVRCARNAPR